MSPLALWGRHPNLSLGPILGLSRSHFLSEGVPSRFSICFVLQRFGPISGKRNAHTPRHKTNTCRKNFLRNYFCANACGACILVRISALNERALRNIEFRKIKLRYSSLMYLAQAPIQPESAMSAMPGCFPTMNGPKPSLGRTRMKTSSLLLRKHV